MDRVPVGVYSHPHDLWVYTALPGGSVVARHQDGRTKVLAFGSPGERAVAEQVAATTLKPTQGPVGQRDTAAVTAALAERPPAREAHSRLPEERLPGGGVVTVAPPAALGESPLPLEGEPGAGIARRVEAMRRTDSPGESEQPREEGTSYLPLKSDEVPGPMRRVEQYSREPGYAPDALGESSTADDRESALTEQDVPKSPPPPRNPDKSPVSLMERIRHVVSESEGPGGQGGFQRGHSIGMAEAVDFPSGMAQYVAQRAPLAKAAAAARAREAAREREYDRDWAAVQAALAPDPAPARETVVAQDEPPVVRRAASRVGMADRDAPSS